MPELSAADPSFVKVFPRNAEFAAKLTFRSDEPKVEVSNIISGNTLTLVLRHSLIALPEPGYVPRTDPYGYTIGLQKVDFSAPLGAPMVKDLARRFRLEKVDPAAARSPVKKPIVFYIDRSAPEPVRTALKEGVSWWNAAFEAAGFENAFQVDVLPEGADPLDVRYNVVNWVDRATRGWSYGQPIADPRTGEIIKGSVLLGSLRTRQDLIDFQALVGAGLTGTGDPNDPITAALARIRQLGAHEVGHALGFAHNFAASTQGRYSVMDYPGPRITLDERGSIACRCLRRGCRSVGPLHDQMALRGRRILKRERLRQRPMRTDCASLPIMTLGRSARGSRLAPWGRRPGPSRRASADHGRAQGCGRAVRHWRFASRQNPLPT